MRYCCDSNVLITANNTYYPVDVFPVFWEWLLQRHDDVGTISWVYRELMDKVGGDNLSDWASEHKDSGFFRSDDDSEEIQMRYAEIVNFVDGMVVPPPEQKAHFLDKADPWIIAYASVRGCTVVTLEQLVSADSKKIKIPNVCREFEVPYMNTFDMLKSENAFFSK